MCCGQIIYSKAVIPNRSWYPTRMLYCIKEIRGALIHCSRRVNAECPEFKQVQGSDKIFVCNKNENVKSSEHESSSYSFGS